MSTEVETKVVAIVDRLRKLADVCERNGIDLCYAMVEGRNQDKPVGIYEGDFVRLFKGREINAVRPSSGMVDVQAELDGVVFSSTIYRPEPKQEPTVVVI